jgi:hypothetical protein
MPKNVFHSIQITIIWLLPYFEIKNSQTWFQMANYKQLAADLLQHTENLKQKRPIK